MYRVRYLSHAQFNKFFNFCNQSHSKKYLTSVHTHLFLLSPRISPTSHQPPSPVSPLQRLVHCLLAEQLNNSNWKVRAVVCDVLGDVKGDINRDMVNKFKVMMWEDWSTDVSGSFC